jgi:uncharacterized protein
MQSLESSPQRLQSTYRLPMQALRAVFTSWPDAALPVAGLLIGVLFGAVLSATNYCVMGAITDWRTAGNLGRLGAVAIAAVTAILGAQALDATGVIDLSKSIYVTTHINWAGALLGGLLFGFGMVYAGGCPSRALVRSGGGDLRALLALSIMAIAAFATISGVLGSFRMFVDASSAIDVRHFSAASQSLSALVGGLGGLSSAFARILAITVVVLPLLYFAIWSANILTSPRNLIAGVSVGALATAGWLATALAADEFASSPAQLTSLSFIRPVADAIDWIERSTALGFPGFGAASVFGVLAGGVLTSWWSGQLKLSGFADVGDAKRHISGATAMGIGGVLALGCSIGQGVTGISTLSVQSLIACAAIIAGAVLGLKRLEQSL